jgi:formate hydrogenlyase subunit 3/multisubunit Na+/H+ antiporter MnhD subunit
MSAPLLWIGIPVLLALGCWFLRKNTVWGVAVSSGGSFFLALLAMLLPVGKVLHLGPLAFEVNPAFQVLGRQFYLSADHRQMLALIFFVAGFWFLTSGVVGVHWTFRVLGPLVIALLVASLAVQPFLYAGLLMEMVVLMSIPLLSPPGQPVSRGVIRYLIFQTFAMPFILFAGNATSGLEVDPSDETLLFQAVVFIGLGFAFWLAIFPFYTWLPQLASETHPYSSGFILSFLPAVVLLIFASYLDAYSWLRGYANLPNLLRLSGTLMVVTGGIWAAFQNDLSRLFGYAVIVENGFALMALSLNNSLGYSIFSAAFLPRMAALYLWSLAVAMLRKNGLGTRFEDLAGVLRRFPVISITILLVVFSFVGLPLLPHLPLRESLLQEMSTKYLGEVLWSLVGMGGFLLAGLRLLAEMASHDEVPWKINETVPQIIIFSLGCLILIGFGLFPGAFYPVGENLLNAFVHLR